MFGNCGWGLNRPAVDASDMVYVSEEVNHLVSVFTPGRGYISDIIRKEGEGTRGVFTYPHGLAVECMYVIRILAISPSHPLLGHPN